MICHQAEREELRFRRGVALTSMLTETWEAFLRVGNG